MKKFIKGMLLMFIILPASFLASERNISFEEALANYEQAYQKYQQDLVQYEADMQKYQQDLDTYNKNLEQDKINQEDYEKKLQQYNKDREKYKQDLAQYNQQKAEYDKVLDQMEADKDKPGHISKPIGQALQFGSDSNATLNITGGTPTNDIAAPKDVVTNNGAHAPNVGRRISKGEQVVATYSNLKNSYYMDKPVTKMVNTFSLDQTLNGQNEMNLFIYNDPTQGFYVENLPTYDESGNGASALRCQTKLYYADGTEVRFSEEYPAVIGVASLNNNNFPGVAAWREEVINYNFEFVPITGSVVKQHGQRGIGGGPIYADQYTNIGNGSGNAFDTGAYGNWDLANSPDFWRVAGAGVITSGSTIDYTIYALGIGAGNESLGGQWTAYTTDIPPKNLPVVPVKPTMPVQPVPPTVLATTKPVPPTPPIEPIKPTPDQYPHKAPKTSAQSITEVLIIIIIASSALYLLNLRMRRV